MSDRSRPIAGQSALDAMSKTALMVIAIILVFAVLKYGAQLFAPLALAIVTGVIVSPLMDILLRTRMPRSVAAATILLSGLLGLAALAFTIEPLIWKIADQLPKLKFEFRAIIEDFRELVRGIEEVDRQVEQALGADVAISEGEGKPEGEDEGEAAPVPTLTDMLFIAPRILAQAMIFVGVLFFFLITRKGIYASISRRIGEDRDTAIIEQRFKNAEFLVSRYFLTITMINFGLGAALAAVLTLIGLPWAIAWGVAAALLNYLLYLGPIAVIIGLTVAGLVTFSGAYSFVPPLAFITLNLMEAQFVTPSLLGHTISLNPLLIFVSLVFGLWLWGPIGGVIAIPVLLIVIALLDVFEDKDDLPLDEA